MACQKNKHFVSFSAERIFKHLLPLHPHFLNKNDEALWRRTDRAALALSKSERLTILTREQLTCLSGAQRSLTRELTCALCARIWTDRLANLQHMQIKKQNRRYSKVQSRDNLLIQVGLLRASNLGNFKLFF